MLKDAEEVINQYDRRRALLLVKRSGTVVLVTVDGRQATKICMR